MDLSGLIQLIGMMDMQDATTATARSIGTKQLWSTMREIAKDLGKDLSKDTDRKEVLRVAKELFAD